jgi:hypothetical protein
VLPPRCPPQLTACGISHIATPFPPAPQERSWHALFDDAHDELSAALATEPFMRGSFAYHWHGGEHHVEGARTKGL